MLARPGAVAAQGRDAGVAAHYGDPYREQRRLAAGEALVDLSHRPVLEVSGPDRLSWLHNLTTQQLVDLKPGELAQTLVLSPHGHIEHHLSVVDDGQLLRAHVEPGTAAALLDWLTSMRFMLRVEVREVTAGWAVLASTTGWTLVERESLAARSEELAGMWAHEALRVQDQRPRLGLDTDHRTIPNETSWLTTAVHLSKGCYRGQETVARVANLGRPPRRLALLHLDGSEGELPEAGTDVLLGERVVGRLGSVARHHELGPIALALIKRQVPADSVLTVEGHPAALEAEHEPPPVRATRPQLMRF